MVTTKRDESLVCGLSQFRVLTLKQIQEYYFGGVARAGVQRRLGDLRRMKVLRSFPFGGSGELAWTLTSEAARTIDRTPEIFRRPPNLNTLPHDLMVTEVGLRLEKLGILKEWITSYELEARNNRFKAEKGHVPDAVFRLEVNGQVIGPIALEVENSLKTRERLLKVLEEYRHTFNVSDLWFMWRKPWMGKTLRELPVPQRPRVWIAQKSFVEDIDLRFDGLGGGTLDVGILAAGSRVTPPETPDVTEEKGAIDAS